jgi:DNA-binding beta-propeller fold protein YncE
MTQEQKKGTKMNRTEHSPKSTRATTGLFGMLAAFLGADATTTSKMGGRALITTLAATAAFFVFPGMALATTGHGFTASFGSEGSAAGNLKEPAGVAVNDKTGDVYVVDRGNNRIDEFTENGTFIRTWGWDVAVGGLGGFEVCTTGCKEGVAGEGAGQLDAPEAIAVDNDATSASKEDVYVTNTVGDTIEKFSATGAYLSQLTGFASAVVGVAVDPAGDVWVAEANGSVQEFSDAVDNALLPPPGETPAFVRHPGIAVDSEDNLYLVRGSGHVAKFSKEGATLEEEVTSSGSATALTIDPATNDLYVDEGSVVAQYGPFGIELKQEFASKQLTDGAGAGISINSSTGAVYVADSLSDDVDVFTLGESPKEAPQTEPASGETPSSAMLHGELNPGGATGKLEYQFDYNLGSSCTGAQSVPVPAGEVAEAKKAVVAATATGLQPSAEYTYCLVAFNLFGEVRGNEVPFKTEPAPPEIIGESTAVPVKATEATLEAKINPNNQETTYSFEYATSKAAIGTAGATKVPSTPGTLPAAFNAEGEPVSAPTEPLTQNTTYYYRVVAENEQSKTEAKPVTGKVEHFTTAIRPEPPTGLEAKPAEIKANTATLNGTLNPGAPGNPGTYEFIYRQSLTECQGAGEKHAPEPAALATGAKGELASTEIKELLPHKTYTFCLLAHNDAGEASTLAGPESFTTLVAPPTISETFSTNIADKSVTLHATVNPQGAETTYAFEYAPPGEGFKPVIEPQGNGTGLLPEGTSDVPLEVHVQEGLEPNTTYQFRVKVRNSAEEVTSEPPVSFTTQPSGLPFVLPDNRAYEMVTPVQKQGAEFKAPGGETEIRAAASGDVIADGAELPTEAGPEGNGNVQVSVLSSRGPSGWSSRVIIPPHPAPGPAREAGGEYVAFSEDLSAAVVDPAAIAFEPLSPQASEQTPYLRTDYFNGNPAEPCDAPYTSAESCYAPLVSSSDDTASPFQPFGGMPQGFCHSQPFHCGPEVRAATADLSHLVLASQVPLTAIAAPTGVKPSLPDLYEYSAGRLQLVSILPGHEEGSPDLYVAGREGSGAELRKGRVAARHAISADGDRVILEESTSRGDKIIRTALYLRDLAKDGGKGETIRLDEPASEPGTEASLEPEYMDANSEGSRIFFLDSAKLTADSGATGVPFEPNEDRPDLYECAVIEVAGKDHCTLTDLTPKTNGESARVATVLGASEDGSYVYFAAAGGLGIAQAGGCENISGGEEHVPASASCNVYVRHDGVTRFVAGLSQQDASDWTNDSGTPPSAVRVAPNGSYLAFLSQRPLTGYDTRSAATGQPVSEAYLYHAPENLGTEAGTLSCASCDPTGARPIGPASVPAWPAFNNFTHPEAFYQPRYLSDEGRLFFNSPDALVEKDVSKQSEVFEYEPVGVGTCNESTSSGSSIYVPDEHGCVALISTGTAAEGSQFLEASAGDGEGEAGEAGSAAGRDVFFLTSEKVLPQDLDTAPDVYDAHECTTASPCIAPPSALRPCETEASCKAPPTPQPTIYAAPSSATFVGPGNLIPPPPAVVTKPKPKVVKCKKGFVKNKKNKCVKKPKKKKTKAKKSAHTNRRTSR